MPSVTVQPPAGGAGETKAPSKPPRQGPLPVSLLSGFLGSGKTTLLKHLLENANGLRIGALVNDMAALNIDAQLVANQDKAESLVQLENGCICCTLKDPLMEHLIKLSQDPNLDYCIIESTGVAEPEPVAQTFSYTTGGVGDANGNPLTDVDGKPLGDVPFANFLTLDTCVTVVDAKNFPGDLETRKKAAERWKDTEEEPEGERDIAEILADQLEFADVIIMNKCDLISEDEAARVYKTIRAFNVGAQIIKSKYSSVNFQDVVGTGKFDMDEAGSNMNWLVQMRKQDGEGKSKKETAVKSELEQFGISSTVYRRRRPFHPKRFALAAGVLSEMGNALLRSKGFIWLATRNEGYGEWSQTGAVWSLAPGAKWMCETPREEWPSDEPEFIARVEMDFDPDPKIGDRRQELVFIGQGLKEEEIIKMMDNCLLTDEEMKGGVEKWKEFEDFFGEWEFEGEEIEEGEEGEGAEENGNGGNQ